MLIQNLRALRVLRALRSTNEPAAGKLFRDERSCDGGAGVEPGYDRLDLADAKLDNEPVICPLALHPGGLRVQIGQPVATRLALTGDQGSRRCRFILIGKKELRQELQPKIAPVLD